ncbi:CRISPR-associated endonuclease Cas1 [Anabaena azotica]|uniref:CRISPR-associated endonuclease Cas1 n=1 Tax=Anabaena azotica TaxID=197653 RepID=UPI0039A66CE2
MPTVYITESGAVLKIQGKSLNVWQQQELRLTLSLSQISQIVIFTHTHITPKTVKLLLSEEIPTLFLTSQGEYIGRLETDTNHTAKYLAKQVQRSQDSEFIRATGESCLWAQLHNQLTLLKNATLRQFNPSLQLAENFLTLLMDDLATAHSLKELREYATSAASFYYPAFAFILPHQFKFPRRSSCKANPINVLFNIGYALLQQQIHCFLKSAGLHPDWANLHQESNNNSPLACDLMAEFRAPLVDELVVNLLNSRIITLKHFTLPDSQGNVELYTHALKLFLQHWEEKLKTTVNHPRAGEVTYRQCLQLQVQEYLACLLGDVEHYRPMLVSTQVSQTDINIIQELEAIPLMMVRR